MKALLFFLSEYIKVNTQADGKQDSNVLIIINSLLQEEALSIQTHSVMKAGRKRSIKGILRVKAALPLPITCPPPLTAASVSGLLPAEL